MKDQSTELNQNNAQYEQVIKTDISIDKSIEEEKGEIKIKEPVKE